MFVGGEQDTVLYVVKGKMDLKSQIVVRAALTASIGECLARSRALPPFSQFLTLGKWSRCSVHIRARLTPSPHALPKSSYSARPHPMARALVRAACPSALPPFLSALLLPTPHHYHVLLPYMPCTASNTSATPQDGHSICLCMPNSRANSGSVDLISIYQAAPAVPHVITAPRAA